MNSAPQITQNELDRLAALSEYDLDYDTLQNSLKDLTLLAAKITGTEISLVNLLDAYNQWTVAQHGSSFENIDRNDSVCQYTIRESEELEIKDLSADLRFNNLSFVTGNGLNYYYGVPLKTLEGYHLGALCVLDNQTKALSPTQKNMLQLIGKEIVNRLDTIKQIELLKNKNRQLYNAKKIAAHDIRNPIAGIIGLAQMICDHGPDNNMDEVLECVTLIKKSGNSVLELAADILNEDANLSEAAVAGASLINLLELKEKILNLFTPRIRDKKIVFSINLSQATASIPFPKDKLQQIIGNLVSNAIKFTPAGGKVTLGLALTPTEQHHVLLITVSDTGVGMEKELVEPILNGSSQSTEGTGGEIGYGLGLWLVKELVSSYRGKLMLSSQKDIGTTFEVSIPIPKQV